MIRFNGILVALICPTVLSQEDHELLLPLVRQENACLPLPINAVARYWGVEMAVAEAAKTARERYRGFGGSVMIEGVEMAERHGLACRIVYSSMPELKAVIGAGIPPIVILPGIPEITQHASVITGYSDAEGTVFHYVQKSTRDGEQQEGAIPQDVFDEGWAEEGRLLIAIAPPETLSSMEFENGSSDESNRLCFASERQGILGDSQGASESLVRAVRLYPANSMAWNMLGALQNGQGSAECVGSYERCLGINGRSYLAHSGLGNHYLKKGRFEEAERCYTDAIGIDAGRSAKIYKNRAFVREKQGKNRAARDDLETYLKYLPDAPDRGAIEQAIGQL